MLLRRIASLFLVLQLVFGMLGPSAVLAQDPCLGNAVANASMEEGSRGTGDLGTRPSSLVVIGWLPWSVWGYSPHSHEAEFDVEDISRLGRYSTYRVHTGQFSQKFSSTFGVHRAGLYQRIAVPQGSLVTFSSWVQIYTGQALEKPGKELVSDLKEPGNYRVSVGIDPFGDLPPGFGAGPSDRAVWSEPVLDHETRRTDENNLPYDGWVLIEVQARAEADHVTVYTRGQPEFPVRANVSYWDDACLTFVAPTPAASPTVESSSTPEPTTSPTQPPTKAPSVTPTATAPLPETPAPTNTSEPTAAVRPTETIVPLPTNTALPADTPLPAPSPTLASAATASPPGGSSSGDTGDDSLLLFIYAALWLSASAYIGWTWWKKREASASE
jgi:hypothetical protein